MGVTQFVNALKGLPISEATLIHILDNMNDEQIKKAISIAFQVLSTILKIFLYFTVKSALDFIGGII